MVKVLKPNTLDDAIKIAHDLESPSSILQPPKKAYNGSTSFQKNKNQHKATPPKMDFETHNELGRKKSYASLADSHGHQIIDVLAKAKYIMSRYSQCYIPNFDLVLKLLIVVEFNKIFLSCSCEVGSYLYPLY